jgi:hypothetical protein
MWALGVFWPSLLCDLYFSLNQWNGKPFTTFKKTNLIIYLIILDSTKYFQLKCLCNSTVLLLNIAISTNVLIMIQMFLLWYEVSFVLSTYLAHSSFLRLGSPLGSGAPHPSEYGRLRRSPGEEHLTVNRCNSQRLCFCPTVPAAPMPAAPSLASCWRSDSLAWPYRQLGDGMTLGAGGVNIYCRE